MPRRTWFKIYAEKWLEGTMRQETLEVRGAWVDILALVANGSYADTGELKFSDEVGFTDEQIASIMKTTPDKWIQIKERLTSTQRISTNSNGIIHIINWRIYQSEYLRQKPYRKLQPEVTGDVETESYF